MEIMKFPDGAAGEAPSGGEGARTHRAHGKFLQVGSFITTKFYELEVKNY